MSTATSSPPDARRSTPRATSRIARSVTDILEPKTWIFGVLMLVGIKSDGIVGAAWAANAAVFAAVVPMLVIKSGVRKGNWSDRHLSARAQRLQVIPLILASLGLGVVVMWAGNAPRELLAAVTNMVATLVIILAITTVWKISVHTSVASGAATMIAMVLGPWWWLTWGLVLLVGWSRIALRDHTPTQVAAGAVLGPALAVAVFAVMV